MSVVGLAAKIEGNVMRRSVYKIWMKTVQIIVVQHQMLHMDIVFQRR